MKNKLSLCLDVIVGEFYLNMYISKELILHYLCATGIIIAITYVLILPMNAVCFLLQFIFSKDPYTLYHNETLKQQNNRIEFNLWIRREHEK